MAESPQGDVDGAHWRILALCGIIRVWRFLTEKAWLISDIRRREKRTA